MYLSNPLSDTKGVKKTVLQVNMNSVQSYLQLIILLGSDLALSPKNRLNQYMHGKNNISIITF